MSHNSIGLLKANGEVDEYGDTNSGSSYELPTASASELGGIKVGSNLSIDNNGVLSASSGGPENYTYYEQTVSGVTTQQTVYSATGPGRIKWSVISSDYVASSSNYTLDVSIDNIMSTVHSNDPAMIISNDNYRLLPYKVANSTQNGVSYIASATFDMSFKNSILIKITPSKSSLSIKFTALVYN